MPLPNMHAYHQFVYLLHTYAIAQMHAYHQFMYLLDMYSYAQHACLPSDFVLVAHVRHC